MVVGKLVHIGVDLVLLSTALAGIRRSTGLKLKPDSLVESKDMQSYVERYLSLGEIAMDFAVTRMGSSSTYFTRDH